MRKIQVLTVLLGAVLVMTPLAARSDSKTHSGKTVAQSEPAGRVEQPIPNLFITPPPLSPGIFPCSDCHADMKTNPKRRKLTEFHEDIRLIHHAEKQRWCLDCHNPDDRDYLRLASGKLVTFGESYYLCGQCHGTIFRDWKAGVHGKRTGEWNGKKIYRLCVQCHNPHNPRFKPITPKPPPIKPADIK
ncbi:MAG TPA: hypothetical protein ENH32_06110 [Proteobacteria bacterium]|nr:doubled CXXCH motif [bacterium BMS3Abin14]HDL53531.1 hypothetical protein [Pseudomonadota bacterium]